MTIPPTRRPRPVLLCILDGWGCTAAAADNAIALARKPAWDRLMRTSPHAVADASELHVGLPSGQMGKMPTRPTYSPVTVFSPKKQGQVPYPLLPASEDHSNSPAV